MDLKSWMVAQGITIREFALLTGRTEVTVARWRAKQHLPDREGMRKIREVTNGAVTANDFYD